MNPIQSNQRIAIVDILRGWALLGVVLINYVDYYNLGIDFKTFQPDHSTSFFIGITNVLFSAKSWTLLSLLFGYGFAMLMQNIAQKGINPGIFFTKRMFWLLIIALINSAFYWGDILKDYAIMGMILLLFYRCKARVTFYISICLLLLVPAVAAYDHSLNPPSGLTLVNNYSYLLKSHNLFEVLWFGLVGTYQFEMRSLNYLLIVHLVMLSCFLLGFSAQKIQFFDHLFGNKKYIKRIFWYSLSSILAIAAIVVVSFRLKLTWLQYYFPFYWVIIASMLFIASAICWLYVSNKLTGFFKSLQVIGRMTLTNYIIQNIIALLLFSGFGFGLSLTNRMHIGYYLLIAALIFIAQIFFSKWWLARFYYGPIEWIWRQLSYGNKIELRRK